MFRLINRADFDAALTDAAVAAGGELLFDLPAEKIDTYRRDGVVLVRGVLSPAEIDLARAAIEQVLAAPGPL